MYLLVLLVVAGNEAFIYTVDGELESSISDVQDADWLNTTEIMILSNGVATIYDFTIEASIHSIEGLATSEDAKLETTSDGRYTVVSSVDEQSVEVILRTQNEDGVTVLETTNPPTQDGISFTQVLVSPDVSTYALIGKEGDSLSMNLFEVYSSEKLTTEILSNLSSDVSIIGWELSAPEAPLPIIESDDEEDQINEEVDLESDADLEIEAEVESEISLPLEAS